MKRSIPVNTLLLCDAENETGIMMEIRLGTELGLRYMHQLFHLELWYFAYGFMDEQAAFELAEEVIRRQWQDCYACDSIEIMDDVLYMLMVFYCLPFVNETAGNQLLIKGITLTESGLHDFMESRKQEARDFVGLTLQKMHPASLN